jgi:hypothetical protein
MWSFGVTAVECLSRQVPYAEIEKSQDAALAVVQGL